jgi:hypothetical protein
VLGLLAWLYLGAQLTIFAAEINVVRTRRLWPRSFFSDPLLEADRRALTSSAEVEERVEEENVEVSFDARRKLTCETPLNDCGVDIIGAVASATSPCQEP